MCLTRPPSLCADVTAPWSLSLPSDIILELQVESLCKEGWMNLLCYISKHLDWPSGVGTHLQGNILIFYGVTENPLERKLLASLRVLHKLNGAETTLRNLADHLVPGKKLLL